MGLHSSSFYANEAFEKSKVEVAVGEGGSGVAEFVEVIDRELAELLVVGDRRVPRYSNVRPPDRDPQAAERPRPTP